MCLSRVFIKSGEQEIEVMQDVAQLDSKDDGYLLTGLLGDQKFVKGKILKIEFVNDHAVVLENSNKKSEEYQ